MEIWKDIEGFEGLYQISDKGRVYSTRREKTLTPKVNRYGYYEVCLWNGKNNYRTIHRLVAQAFLDKDETRNVVNHKDMNKKNNDVSNLEWATVQENTKHAYDNSETYRKRCKELHTIGVEARKMKLDAFLNGEYVGSYNGKLEAAQALGISQKTIYNRLHNKFSARTGYTFALKAVN